MVCLIKFPNVIVLFVHEGPWSNRFFVLSQQQQQQQQQIKTNKLQCLCMHLLIFTFCSYEIALNFQVLCFRQHQGCSKGGPGVPANPPPPFGSFFKQTTYNRWQKRHDNLASTLTLTQCDPFPPPPAPAL